MRAIVVANSAKNNGLCLAVFYPADRMLYRLVSSESGAEIPYNVANAIKPLDIVDFIAIKKVPNGPQTENILINLNYGVRCVGHYSSSIEEISKQVVYPKPLTDKIFGTDSYKLYEASYLTHSLEIRKVSDLTIVKEDGYGRTTGKASFVFKNSENKYYSVTDFNYDIRKKSITEWDIGDAYIVVSLPATPYYHNDEKKGYYKFIAAIYKA